MDNTKYDTLDQRLCEERPEMCDESKEFLNHLNNMQEKNLDIAIERSSAYGNNFDLFGGVMAKMFPRGLILSSEKDFTRMGILTQMMSKMTRYANNFDKGGHADSLSDLSNYSMMMSHIDTRDDLPPAKTIVEDFTDDEIPF